jgi:hypothetical protein
MPARRACGIEGRGGLCIIIDKDPLHSMSVTCFSVSKMYHYPIDEDILDTGRETILFNIMLVRQPRCPRLPF